MAYPIRIYPDPVLSQPTKPVEDFNGEALGNLLSNLERVLGEIGGLGLAANQIGDASRVAILKREDGSIIELINPSIVASSEPVTFPGEGCLSFPGLRFHTKRFNKVTVLYKDRAGVEQSLEATGLLAIECQHEIDHLDGRLIIDGQSPLMRKLAKERMAKLNRLAARNRR
jgi:peptide deformylase